MKYQTRTVCVSKRDLVEYIEYLTGEGFVVVSEKELDNGVNWAITFAYA